MSDVLDVPEAVVVTGGADLRPVSVFGALSDIRAALTAIRIYNANEFGCPAALVQATIAKHEAVATGLIKGLISSYLRQS